MSSNPRFKQWFSIILPIDERNADLPVPIRKKNAQDACKKILQKAPLGRFWDISSFKWKGRKKHRLTVKLKRKNTNPNPPGDPRVPPVPVAPPPSM
jgi:hypothetical protein